MLLNARLAPCARAFRNEFVLASCIDNTNV